MSHRRSPDPSLAGPARGTAAAVGAGASRCGRIATVPDPPRVVSLHRYPVKSMAGEQVTRLDVDGRGCVGDRLWSVRTAGGKIGSGKETRRFAAVPGLLELRAAERDGRVVVTFPDGSSCATDAADADDRLSRHLGRPLTFALETAVSHFDAGPVSLVGCASVAAVCRAAGERVDPARFRANIVLDTSRPFVEDEWIGRRLEVGTAVLQVSLASPRCVMVDMRTADLPAQPGNLAAIGRVNGANLGVVASVVVPGSVSVGDTAALAPPPEGPPSSGRAPRS